MKCLNCGSENPDKAIYCWDCGQKLIAKCPKCGMEITPNKNFCSYCGTDLREGSKDSADDKVIENEAKKEISKDGEPEGTAKTVDPFEVLTKKEETKNDAEQFSALKSQDKPKAQSTSSEGKDAPQVLIGRDITISDEAIKILTEEVKSPEKKETDKPDKVHYSTTIDGNGFGYAAFFSYVYSPASCVASFILAISSLVTVFEIDSTFLVFAAFYLFCGLIMLCSSLRLRYFSRFALDGVLTYHVLDILVTILFCFIKESYAFGGIISIVLLIISFVYFCKRRKYYTE